MRHVAWAVTSLALCGAVACGGSESENGAGGGTGGAPGGASGTGASAGTGGSAGASTGGASSGGAAGAGGASSGGATGGGGASSGGGSGGGGGAAPWQPKPGTTWQWQLTGSVDTTVDAAMFDIDLFEAPPATIDTLHAKGRVVVCYFSAGSREDWRSDAKDFKSTDYGKALVGWPGENWLDIRAANVRAIMKKRLDLAVSKKCDGVEPDNVDGYANDSGFPLTEADQLDYDKFLAAEAHARGLSVGLKNSVELVPKLLSHFDWALNEECLSFSECASLAPFIQANKAVFHVEYVDQQSQGAAKKGQVCGKGSIAGFSTLIKTWDLDAWRLTCP